MAWRGEHRRYLYNLYIKIVALEGFHNLNLVSMIQPRYSIYIIVILGSIESIKMTKRDGESTYHIRLHFDYLLVMEGKRAKKHR